MNRLSGIALVFCLISAAHAGDTPSSHPTVTASVEDVRSLAPSPSAIRSLQSLGDAVGSDGPPKDNPLSSIPLSALSATRERPLFAVTRRPPPLSAVAGSAAETATNDTAPKSEQPPFSLMGTIISSDARIAVLLDQSTNQVVQLRQGKAASGWSAVFIGARAISLQKGESLRTVKLPSQDPALGARITSGRLR